MKRLIMFCVLVFLGVNTVPATVILCGQDLTRCWEISHVSYDSGQTWQNACCSDMTGPRYDGYTCEDDCDLASLKTKTGKTSPTTIELPLLEGVEWKYIDESNSLIKHIAEFVDNKLYLDGHVIIETSFDVTNLVVKLPGLNQYIGFKNTCKEKEYASNAIQQMIRSAGQSEVKAHERIPKINLCPNPMINGQIYLNSSHIITSADIYNVSGLHVSSYIFEKGIKQAKLDLALLEDGMYFLEFEVPRYKQKVIKRFVI